MKEFFVIGYDICDVRRLSRMHRFWTQHALAVQKSVFFFWGEEGTLRQRFIEAEKILRKTEDTLSYYRLPVRGRKIRLGVPAVPEGIFLGVPISKIK